MQKRYSDSYFRNGRTVKKENAVKAHTNKTDKQWVERKNLFYFEFASFVAIV